MFDQYKAIELTNNFIADKLMSNIPCSLDLDGYLLSDDGNRYSVVVEGKSKPIHYSSTPFKVRCVFSVADGDMQGYEILDRGNKKEGSFASLVLSVIVSLSGLALAILPASVILNNYNTAANAFNAPPNVPFPFFPFAEYAVVALLFFISLIASFGSIKRPISSGAILISAGLLSAPLPIGASSYNGQNYFVFSIAISAVLVILGISNLFPKTKPIIQ